MQMNDNNTDRLSVQELEELCRLYLDCRLTRPQEQELHFVLLHYDDAHSELIDEVRGLMDFELRLSMDSERSVAVRPKRWQRWSIFNIAASLLILLASAATLTYFSASNIQKDATYMVYVDGIRIDDRSQAEAIIRADIDKANEMLERSAEIRRQQQQKMTEIQHLHHKYQQQYM